ncbi:OLC1v1033835C1 [Oldenlandia corymbosa var. corymbosa]|uniref:OLC1v1033835C1 n=1 Tax=Oldenlandia corymbosa var. corymbosa TaxID=529605 RepID=A0AAV1CQF0_OLDCO|nr:OLC1v1033835C1 [Oldenlandia corymbosa var. corymbosa]
MAGSPHPKILHHHPLHSFSLKSTSSSSTHQLTSSKLKNVLQTFIFSHLYRILRAVAKAKSIVIQVLKDIQLLHFNLQQSMKKNSKNLKNKLFLGSFRMHYNWCTPHVVPVPMPQQFGDHIHKKGYNYNNSSSFSSNDWYYDSSWNVSNNDIGSTTDSSSGEFMVAHQELHSSSARLTGYLQWLEERDDQDIQHDKDIDKLADMFIANCHEKFRLEKQESYRRFQEMMNRSI